MKLLFIPGSGGGSEEWRYQTEYFPDAEAVPLPGRSGDRPCASIAEYVEWLRDYIQRQRYQDVVLAGHSMGTAIAQLYSSKYGVEVKALVLLGGGARLRVLPAMLTMLEKMTADEAAWRRFVEGIYQRVAPEIRQFMIEARLRIGAAVILNDLRCCDAFDIMDRVDTIKTPTLLICGSEDEMTPVKYTNFLADKIAGAKQVIIPGGTHFVYMEKPAEVNQAIEEFLAAQ
ncbi:alpha/beta fold hydrolase [Chloroflexota bacterium]